jgi:Cdc6-like AAA superfamily ATPase
MKSSFVGYPLINGGKKTRQPRATSSAVRNSNATATRNFDAATARPNLPEREFIGRRNLPSDEPAGRSFPSEVALPPRPMLSRPAPSSATSISSEVKASATSRTYDQILEEFRGLPNDIPSERIIELYEELTAAPNQTSSQENYVKSLAGAINDMRNDIESKGRVSADNSIKQQGGGGASGSGSEKPQPVLDDPLNRVSFYSPDFVGMDRERAEIEKQFIDPQIWTNMFAAARTMLLYGPPGGGKTYLVKGMVNAFRDKLQQPVHFFAPTNAALKGKYSGQVEKNLVNWFETAQREAQKTGSVSILFFDEIESLASARSDENQVMNASVTQLLTLINGADSHKYNRVLVVGATNLPWSLDEAILRRFSTRIFVDLPSSTSVPVLLYTALGRRLRLVEESERLQENVWQFCNALAVQMGFQTGVKKTIKGGSSDPRYDLILRNHVESSDAVSPVGFNASDITNFVDSVVNDLALKTLYSTGNENPDGCKYICLPSNVGCEPCRTNQEERSTVKVDVHLLRDPTVKLEVKNRLTELKSSVNGSNYIKTLRYAVDPSQAFK